MEEAEPRGQGGVALQRPTPPSQRVLGSKKQKQRVLGERQSWRGRVESRGHVEGWREQSRAQLVSRGGGGRAWGSRARMA